MTISRKPAHLFHALAHLCEPLWLGKFLGRRDAAAVNDNWSPEAA